MGLFKPIMLFIAILVSIMIFVIAIFGKQSPYEHNAYCNHCKKDTMQREVVVGFKPQLSCEICNNLN